MQKTTHDYSGLNFIIVDGRKWYLFSVCFDGDDGKFSIPLYATSWEHAAALLTDLRETAVLDGAICN